MKKFIVLASILLTSFTAIFAQNADGIKGVWINDAKDAKVEIYKSGDKYFGKITWVKDMYEADGKTIKKDSKNSNEKLRSRNVVGMDILSGFTYDDGEWTGGELYDPKSGKTYESKLKLKGSILEIRGYVGSPMFGKSTTWTKTT
jgi:uncharacterized protein (DUF2147 family)